MLQGTDTKKTLKVNGPWRGIREVSPDDGDFDALWNVEIRGGRMGTRNGRKLVYSGTNRTQYPVAAYVFLDGAYDPSHGVLEGARVDVTKQAQGDQAYASEFLNGCGGGVGHVNDALWLGFQSKVNSVRFTQTTAGHGNRAASVMSAAYLGASGWAAMTVEDGTSTDGVTMTKTGTVGFTVPADWKACSFPNVGSGTPPMLRNRNLYWIKLTFSATLDGGYFDSAVGAITDQSSSYGPNGLFHWRTPLGERITILGLDDKDAGVARLFAYDRVRGVLRPFEIEAGAAKSGPDAFWQFVAMPEALVACNGHCLLYATADDPLRLRPFAPVTLEKDNTQRNSPPLEGDFICEYEGRLIVAKGNKVWVSAPVGDVLGIDSRADAPLRGASVFYDFAYFTIIDESGGVVTGLGVVGSTLVIFTSNTTWSASNIDTWNGPSACRCVDPNHGCTAPRSVKSVDRDTLVFLAKDGIYATDGATNKLISGGIQRTVDGLNRFSLQQAVAEVYKAKRQYRLWVPSTESPRNDVGLILHYESGAWTKFGTPKFLDGMDWADFEISCLAATRDDEWEEDLLSLDYSGNLYLEDHGEYDGTYPILTVMALAPIKATEQTYCVVRHARFSVLTDGDGEVRVGLLVNNTPWEQTDTDDVLSVPIFNPSDADQSDSFSLLDARVSADQQCYTQWLYSTPDAIVPVLTEGTGDGFPFTLSVGDAIPSTELRVLINDSNKLQVWYRLSGATLWQPLAPAKIEIEAVAGTAYDLGALSTDLTHITLTTGAAFDAATQEGAYTVTLSNDNAPYKNMGFTLGTDAWVERRVLLRHADFGLTARNARLVIHAGTTQYKTEASNGISMARFELAGMEIEVTPSNQKREDD